MKFLKRIAKEIVVLGFRASRFGKRDDGSVIKLFVDQPIERGPRSCRFLWLAERAGVTHGARRLFVCFSSGRLAGNRRSASYTCSRRSFSRRAGCNYITLAFEFDLGPKFVYTSCDSLPLVFSSRYALATKQRHTKRAGEQIGWCAFKEFLSRPDTNGQDIGETSIELIQLIEGKPCFHGGRVNYR